LTRFFLILLIALLMPDFAAADSRGLSVQLRVSEAKNAPVTGAFKLYSQSHALVIGIDAYTNGWPRLSNAVKDAKLVAAALQKKGFEVTLKTNLNSARLKQVLEEFFILKGNNVEARLFVWFAGHGHTLDGEGYLVPADGPRPDGSGRFKLKALNMRRFETFVREANAKHVLNVFDACFAGTVFNVQRSLPSTAITRATTEPVRQFLTSGDADQTVSDDGRFRRLFIRALEGGGRVDANADGYLTGSELGMYLTDRLTNLSNARQTPRYGKLNDDQYDRGDFVFELASTALTSPTGPVSSNSQISRVDREALFWQSIKNSTDPIDFRDYLNRFPNGTYSGLARRRLEPSRQTHNLVAPKPALPNPPSTFRRQFLSPQLPTQRVERPRYFLASVDGSDGPKYQLVSNRFTQVSPGMIFDRYLNKHWVPTGNRFISDWGGAQKYLSSLKQNLRLPTIEELRSLITRSRDAADWGHINSLYFQKNSRTSRYWSTSSSLFSEKWFVDFSNGSWDKMSGTNFIGIIGILD
jgi:hypothetical protein